MIATKIIGICKNSGDIFEHASSVPDTRHQYNISNLLANPTTNYAQKVSAVGHQQTEQHHPKEERELIAQMLPIARFQTHKEHDDFFARRCCCVSRSCILAVRKNGVHTLAELFDAEKKKDHTEQRDQSGTATGDPQDHPRTWSSLVSTGASAGSADATFSIDDTPGSHLLTPKEKELCCKLKLMPKV